MSDETKTEDQELEEMRQQLEAAGVGTNQQAATAVEEPPMPSPVEVPETPPAATTPEPTQEPVTPNPSAPEKVADTPSDATTWAQKKGLKTYEDAVRALHQKEQEFHKRNQAGHPGYQDLGNPVPPQPPAPPAWQPRPDMSYQPAPGYGYPPPRTREDIAESLGRRHGVDPEDVRRLLPLIAEVGDAAATFRTSSLEREVLEMRRQTARNSELMNLSQDPAFHDMRVQQEIHSILDSDPSIFQRERSPYSYAFERALGNMARKQLQQGVTPDKTPRPPVTAGGGNGSANITPSNFNDPAFQRMFESWPLQEQEAFLKSGGKVFPKR